MSLQFGADKLPSKKVWLGERLGKNLRFVKNVQTRRLEWDDDDGWVNMLSRGRKQANRGEKKDVHNLQLEVKTCKGANVKPLIGCQMQVVLSCVGG